MPTQKTRCFAVSLGGCDGISAEHIVSKALFNCTAVVTRGLPIPEGKPISTAALTAKILCRKHNSQLSDLDAEIGRLGTALSTMTSSSHSNRIAVSGLNIERWCLKVALGTFASGWIGGIKSQPPPGVLHCLFGEKPLPPTVSLFGIANIERTVSAEHTFSFDYFQGRVEGTSGFIFSIYGVPFLLSICLDSPEDETRERGFLSGVPLASASIKHHPPSIIATSDKGTVVEIDFKWDRLDELGVYP